MSNNTIIGPRTAMERFYHDRQKRAEELCDILLEAVERIVKDESSAPIKIAEAALEAYDAANERHFQEDADAERAYAAEEAADAKREAMWEEGQQ